MKPVALPYPDILETIGDHIRTKRLDLELRQKDVARQLGVNVMTVNYCETHRNQPSLRMIPRIIDFLGYNPNLDAQPDETRGERIVRVRLVLGIRQKDLARQLRFDPTTLARWELGTNEPIVIPQHFLSEFFFTSGYEGSNGNTEQPALLRRHTRGTAKGTNSCPVLSLLL